MRRPRPLFALAPVLFITAVMAPPATAQGPVKLAVVAEITGGGAPSGTMWRDGVLLAVEDINKKGGILGRPLESFVMDTQTDPPTSTRPRSATACTRTCSRPPRSPGCSWTPTWTTRATPTGAASSSR